MKAIRDVVPDELEDVLYSDLSVLGGAVYFAGTRVPLSTFLDHLELGISVDDFLEGYPGVSRVQVVQVLAWMCEQSRKSVGITQPL